MNNIILNKQATEYGYKLRFVNNPKSLNVSIIEKGTNKKRAYASGHGYDKVAAVFNQLLETYLLKDTDRNTLDQIKAEIDKGQITSYGDIDEERAIKYFSSKGLYIWFNWVGKKECHFVIKSL